MPSYLEVRPVMTFVRLSDKAIALPYWLLHIMTNSSISNAAADKTMPAT